MKKVEISFATLMALWLGSIIFFGINIPEGDAGLSELGFVACVVMIVLTAAVVGVGIFYGVYARWSDNKIVQTFGDPSNVHKTFRLYYNFRVDIYDECSIRLPMILSFDCEKIQQVIRGKGICVYWRDIKSVEIRRGEILLRSSSDGEELRGWGLPLRKNLFYLVKTFYKGAITNGELALQTFEGSNEREAVDFAHSQARVSSIRLVLISLAHIAAGAGIAVGLLTLVGGMEGEYADIIMIAIIFSMLISMPIFCKMAKPYFASIKISDKAVRISDYSGLGVSADEKWSKIKSIVYNKNFIRFEGEHTFFYPNSPKVLDAVDRAAAKRGVKIEEVSEPLHFSEFKGRRMMGIDVAYGGKYYLDGVEIFDFDRFPTALKRTKVVTITSKENGKNHNRNCEVRYFRVQGRSCSFVVGAADYSKHKTRIFVKWRDVKKLFSNANIEMLKVDTDKNLELKLDYALRLDSSKPKIRGATYLSSDNKRMRAVIVDEDGRYAVRIEELGLIDYLENYKGEVFDDLYFWNQMDRPFTADSKEQAISHAKEVFEREFVLSSDSYKVLQANLEKLATAEGLEREELLAEQAETILMRLECEEDYTEFLLQAVDAVLKHVREGSGDLELADALRNLYKALYETELSFNASREAARLLLEFTRVD